MSDDENSERRDRLTRATLVGLSAIGLLLIGARVAWSWPSLQVLAGSLQLLGILMTALGVAAVWSLLELLADEASDAKRSIARSWAATRQRVWLWWLRRRGKTTPAYIVGSSAGVSGGGAILTVGHPSVDRDTISDRDWLVFLNDQLDLLREDLRIAQKRHSEDSPNDSPPSKTACVRRCATNCRRRRAKAGSWSLQVSSGSPLEPSSGCPHERRAAARRRARPAAGAGAGAASRAAQAPARGRR